MHLTHESYDPVIWTGVAFPRFNRSALHGACAAHEFVGGRTEASSPFADRRHQGVTACVGVALGATPDPVRPSPHREPFTVGLRLLFAASRAIERFARRALLRYQQNRKAHAVRNALQHLDDRMLRDLGFHRDEIESVAAEISGQAARTRVRSLLEPHGPC